MRLILASASPRRAELLASAGFDFEVVPADVDESVLIAEPPAVYALRVATAKATSIAQTRSDPQDVILAADTVVVARGEILGKPTDTREAAAMLGRLSGAVHDVLTAVVLSHDGRMHSDVVTTHVQFALMSEEEIEWYVASGEPDGKAGAYAIQGRAARFIDRIEGSWSNVVGLPIATVHRLLSAVSIRD